MDKSFVFIIIIIIFSLFTIALSSTWYKGCILSSLCANSIDLEVFSEL